MKHRMALWFCYYLPDDDWGCYVIADTRGRAKSISDEAIFEENCPELAVLGFRYREED